MSTQHRSNIFAELKSDHREIKSLCKKILDSASGDTASARQNFEKLRLKLTSHAKAEEAIFYAPLKQRAESDDNDDLKDLVLEGYEEHHVADMLLKELHKLNPSDERWMAKMTVLSEALDHHIKEEEEDMFSDSREELNRSEIQSMGPVFVEKKADIVQRLS